MISNLSKAKFLFWSPKFPKLILNLAYKIDHSLKKSLKPI